MAAPRQDGQAGGGKFGKFLAVGMAIALIWGILITFVGVYMRLSFGSILNNAIGQLEPNVHLASAVSEHGQNIAPTTSTIKKDLDVGSWVHLISTFVLGVGTLTIVFSCLGVYGGLRHNRVVLIVTIVILLVTVLILLIMTGTIADPDASYHSEAKNELVEKLRREYTVETTDNAFVLAMNTIMLYYQCCGISGVRDFQNLTFTERVKGHADKEYIFKVSPSCCIRELYNEDATDHLTPFSKIKDCAIKGYDVMENLNSQGCYKKLLEAYSLLIAICLGLVAAWHIIVLVLAILTIMEIKPEEEVFLKEKEKIEEEEVAPVVKKFIPFAKISSFVHPDITRIKSTEIW